MYLPAKNISDKHFQELDLVGRYFQRKVRTGCQLEYSRYSTRRDPVVKNECSRYGHKQQWKNSDDYFGDTDDGHDTDTGQGYNIIIIAQCLALQKKESKSTNDTSPNQPK